MVYTLEYYKQQARNSLRKEKTLICIWCNEKSIVSETAKMYQCDECYEKVVEKREKDTAYFKYQSKILNICNCIHGHMNCKCGTKNGNKR